MPSSAHYYEHVHSDIMPNEEATPKFQFLLFPCATVRSLIIQFWIEFADLKMYVRIKIYKLSLDIILISNW